MTIDMNLLNEAAGLSRGDARLLLPTSPLHFRRAQRAGKKKRLDSVATNMNLDGTSPWHLLQYLMKRSIS